MWSFILIANFAASIACDSRVQKLGLRTAITAITIATTATSSTNKVIVVFEPRRLSFSCTVYYLRSAWRLPTASTLILVKNLHGMFRCVSTCNGVAQGFLAVEQKLVFVVVMVVVVRKRLLDARIASHMGGESGTTGTAAHVYQLAHDGVVGNKLLEGGGGLGALNAEVRTTRAVDTHEAGPYDVFETDEALEPIFL